MRGRLKKTSGWGLNQPPVPLQFEGDKMKSIEGFEVDFKKQKATLDVSKNLPKIKLMVTLKKTLITKIRWWFCRKIMVVAMWVGGFNFIMDTEFEDDKTLKIDKAAREKLKQLGIAQGGAREFAESVSGEFIDPKEFEKPPK